MSKQLDIFMIRRGTGLVRTRLRSGDRAIYNPVANELSFWRPAVTKSKALFLAKPGAKRPKMKNAKVGVEADVFRKNTDAFIRLIALGAGLDFTADGCESLSWTFHKA